MGTQKFGLGSALPSPCPRSSLLEQPTVFLSRSIDWSNYPSRSFAKRAMGADSDQDKLKMLSEGIQNAVTEFLVSLHYRSSAHRKQLFFHPDEGNCCYSTGHME